MEAGKAAEKGAATNFIHTYTIARLFPILIVKETGPNLDIFPDLTVARQFHIATLRQDYWHFLHLHRCQRKLGDILGLMWRRGLWRGRRDTFNTCGSLCVAGVALSVPP